MRTFGINWHLYTLFAELFSKFFKFCDAKFVSDNFCGISAMYASGAKSSHGTNPRSHSNFTSQLKWAASRVLSIFRVVQGTRVMRGPSQIFVTDSTEARGVGEVSIRRSFTSLPHARLDIYDDGFSSGKLLRIRVPALRCFSQTSRFES